MGERLRVTATFRLYLSPRASMPVASANQLYLLSLVPDAYATGGSRQSLHLEPGASALSHGRNVPVLAS